MNTSRQLTHPLLTRSLLLLATLLVADIAPAQRLVMPGDRILQMFDLRMTRNEKMHGKQPMFGSTSDEAVTMLRSFIEPALRKGDDIKAIGPHWIAVLADEQRIASVDRIFQAAKKHRNDLMTIEVRLLDFKKDVFQKVLAESLVKVERGDVTTYESVIEKDEARAFAKRCLSTANKSLAAPKLSVMPLQQANVSMVKTVPYIKDFTVERSDTAVIADPVVGTTWEGHKATMLATFLPDGRIGLSCEVQIQELHRPIPKAEITVVKNSQPVTIQLPRTSGVKLANVAELSPGSLVVLATERRDGTFIVAVVRATATGNR